MSVVTDLLHGHFQVLVEMDRIGKMPAVEPMHRYGLCGIRVRSSVVTSRVIWVSEVWAAIRYDWGAVARRIGLKRPGPSEIVLGTGPADRWPLLIAVNKEL